MLTKLNILQMFGFFPAFQKQSLYFNIIDRRKQFSNSSGFKNDFVGAKILFSVGILDFLLVSLVF